MPLQNDTLPVVAVRRRLRLDLLDPTSYNIKQYTVYTPTNSHLIEMTFLVAGEFGETNIGDGYFITYYIFGSFISAIRK